jgi:hypothetical protein
MKIALLDNYKGVIVDRTPFIATDTLDIEIDADGKTLVVACKDGIKHYLAIKDGKSTVPTKDMDGVVHLFVKNFDKSITTWKCESLKCQRVNDGVLIAPNDSDLPEHFAQLQIDYQNMSERVKILEDYIRAVNKRIDSMVEGWAVI